MQENIENKDNNSVTPVNTVIQTEQQPKQSNFLVILLSILLIISVVIAGFFAYQTQKLVKELTMLKTSPTPEVTTEPVATVEPTADWKTYIDSINQFTFMYPPSLQIINDTKNIPMNSIYVSVESVDFNTAIKQDEFEIAKLKDILILGRSTEAFKKGSFERSTNGLIAFFPLNQSQTLIISEYFDAPVTDTTINDEFEKILTSIKFTN